MTKIKHDAKGDKSIEEELVDGFWRLMGWRSRDTMDMYTHVINKRMALLEVMLEEAEDPSLQAVQRDSPPSCINGQQKAGDATVQTTNTPCQNDDNFGWYEQ